MRRQRQRQRPRKGDGGGGGGGGGGGTSLPEAVGASDVFLDELKQAIHASGKSPTKDETEAACALIHQQGGLRGECLDLHRDQCLRFVERGVPGEVSGWTPLHRAAYWGHDATCEWLEQLAPDDVKALVRAKNDSGWTPLHVAARYGHERILRWSIARGADARTKDMHGWSPLFYAARGGHSDICVWLVQDCAVDPLLRDNKGRTVKDVVVGRRTGVEKVLGSALLSLRTLRRSRSNPQSGPGSGSPKKRRRKGGHGRARSSTSRKVKRRP